MNFLLFDDKKIRPLGGWDDVKKECLKSFYQPVLLLYELEDPMETLSKRFSTSGNENGRNDGDGGRDNDKNRDRKSGNGPDSSNVNMNIMHMEGTYGGKKGGKGEEDEEHHLIDLNDEETTEKEKNFKKKRSFGRIDMNALDQINLGSTDIDFPYALSSTRSALSTPMTVSPPPDFISSLQTPFSIPVIANPMKTTEKPEISPEIRPDGLHGAFPFRRGVSFNTEKDSSEHPKDSGNSDDYDYHDHRNCHVSRRGSIDYNVISNMTVIPITHNANSATHSPKKDITHDTSNGSHVNANTTSNTTSNTASNTSSAKDSPRGYIKIDTNISANNGTTKVNTVNMTDIIANNDTNIATITDNSTSNNTDDIKTDNIIDHSSSINHDKTTTNNTTSIAHSNATAVPNNLRTNYSNTDNDPTMDTVVGDEILPILIYETRPTVFAVTLTFPIPPVQDTPLTPTTPSAASSICCLIPPTTHGQQTAPAAIVPESPRDKVSSPRPATPTTPAAVTPKTATAAPKTAGTASKPAATARKATASAKPIAAAKLGTTAGTAPKVATVAPKPPTVAAKPLTVVKAAAITPDSAAAPVVPAVPAVAAKRPSTSAKSPTIDPSSPPITAPKTSTAAASATPAVAAKKPPVTVRATPIPAQKPVVTGPTIAGPKGAVAVKSTATAKPTVAAKPIPTVKLASTTAPKPASNGVPQSAKTVLKGTPAVMTNSTSDTSATLSPAAVGATLPKRRVLGIEYELNEKGHLIVTNFAANAETGKEMEAYFAYFY